MPFIENIARLANRLIERCVLSILGRFGAYRFFIETRQTQTPVTFSLWFRQKILGHNREAYWPVHPASVVKRGGKHSGWD